ncbi:MAG: hypothetical protein V3V01_14055 [Acidimicrobiales bacterium]
MLFDISNDAHEQHDLSRTHPEIVTVGATTLQEWTNLQMERSFSPIDPMQIVIDEGGPFHEEPP